MYFEISLILILYKFKKRPNISGIWVVQQKNKQTKKNLFFKVVAFSYKTLHNQIW